MTAQLDEYEAASEEYPQTHPIDVQVESALSPKLERRRRIEELAEAKRLREELDI